MFADVVLAYSYVDDNGYHRDHVASDKLQNGHNGVAESVNADRFAGEVDDFCCVGF